MVRTMSEPSIPVACDLTRLTGTEKARVTELAAQLFPRAVNVVPLDDGYELGFEDVSTEQILEFAEFIAYDRLCCEFLRHTLICEPGGRKVTLRLTGPAGTREALDADIAALLPRR